MCGLETLLFHFLNKETFLCSVFNTKIMKVLERFNALKAIFDFNKNCAIENSPLEIVSSSFTVEEKNKDLAILQKSFENSFGCHLSDYSVSENNSFNYPIFRYKGSKKNSSVIILLHGLNERSWEKYLCWAEFLALHTGKPVLLFPIAFHVNRTPSNWYLPRAVSNYVSERRNILHSPENLSVANIALSDRLTDNPLRFYTSGKETIDNICQLLMQIKQGRNRYFTEDAKVDFFTYSIGSLLGQVMLLSNPESLFSDSKLFMFCGGSVFNKMNGNSRYIMDKVAFSKLFDYYQYTFLNNLDKQDTCDQAFKSMIDANVMKEYREKSFLQAASRIKAISLKKDTVIPTQGIRKALGDICAEKCLTEYDFSFEYCHEMPFPMQEKYAEEVDVMFDKVFSIAGDFLC